MNNSMKKQVESSNAFEHSGDTHENNPHKMYTLRVLEQTTNYWAYQIKKAGEWHENPAIHSKLQNQQQIDSNSITSPTGDVPEATNWQPIVIIILINTLFIFIITTIIRNTEAVLTKWLQVSEVPKRKILPNHTVLKPAKLQWTTIQ